LEILVRFQLHECCHLLILRVEGRWEFNVNSFQSAKTI
jgi:hypothetical protein